MNREILFKAKRKDNGEWVEGYYRADPDLNNHFICGWNYYLSENGLEREPFEYEINSGTLCQYTGLTDKNGKKIWENDIVRNGKGDIGVVQWFEEHAVFMIWNKTKHHVYYLAENDFSKIEIAGNEFDNPELLEVER